MAFVNKMDRVGGDYFNVLAMMKERLGANPLPIVIPIGAGELFTGIIDLLDMKAILYNESTLGARFEYSDIPHDMIEEANKWRHHLIEETAAYDEHLLEKYLEGEEISIDELKAAIRKGCIDNTFVPTLCGSAFKNKGVQRLLDAIIDFLPSPIDVGEVVGYDPNDNEIELKREPNMESPFSALAFKIMTDPFVGRLTYMRVYSGKLDKGSYIYNSNIGKRERVSRILQMHANKREERNEVAAGEIVAVVGLKNTNTGHTVCDEKHGILLESMDFPEPVVEVSVEPVSKAEQDNLSKALAKLSEEDPTFKLSTNIDTGQTIISGMGELHLEILIDRLLREFKVQAHIGKPQVAFSEAITKKVEKIDVKFARQSGGRGQYGHVGINVEPNEVGKGFHFEDKIVGGVIPKEYIPSVEKGVTKGLDEGVLAGFPIVDLKAVLYDGSFHDVDSSGMSFEIASGQALKAGLADASPILLEPVMKLSVTTPDGYTGEVMSDLNTKRSRILGMTPGDNSTLIEAEVPLAEVQRYAQDLRSVTQGRGTYQSLIHI